MLFLHNTSRVEGEPYGDLLKVKGFRGFPTLAFMDAQGEVLTSGFDRSVKGFETTAAALATVAELGKADTEGKLEGDAAARLLIAKIDLGQADLATVTARVAKITGNISAENRKALDQRLIDFAVGGIFNKAQEVATPKQQQASAKLRPADGTKPTEEQVMAARKEMADISAAMQEAIAADLLPLLTSNRIPSDKLAYRFWTALWQHAQKNKNDEVSKQARAGLEGLATRQPSMQPMIERMLNPGSAPARAVPATPLRPAGEPKPGEAKSGDGKKSADAVPVTSGKSNSGSGG